MKPTWPLQDVRAFSSGAFLIVSELKMLSFLFLTHHTMQSFTVIKTSLCLNSENPPQLLLLTF